MSCQKILSMLSEYIDGEAPKADVETIENHVAGCVSCARELEMLRNTVQMLAETPESEPPAFLLEQIEAATVNRPTVGDRVRAAIKPVMNIPSPVRWTAAVTATAGLVLAMFISNQDVPTTYTAIESKPVEMVAVEPITDVEIVEVETEIPQIGEVTEPTRVTRMRVVRDHVEQLTKKPAAKTTVEEEVKKVEIAVQEEAAEPVIDNFDGPVYGPERPARVETPVVAAEPEVERADPQVTLARDLSASERIEQENMVLGGLQEELANRNRQRRHNVSGGPVESTKYSVELASIRF